jgi:hypothetical protein
MISIVKRQPFPALAGRIEFVEDGEFVIESSITISNRNNSLGQLWRPVWKPTAKTPFRWHRSDLQSVFAGNTLEIPFETGVRSR